MNKKFISDQYAKYKQTRKKITKIPLPIDDIPEQNSKIAIIVPFRNNKYQQRDIQLAKFIQHYHNYLDNLDIYIIEQSDDNKKFNRGATLNIGFQIAKKNNYDMYIFHDVDLISPKEIRNIYSYKSDIPEHIGSLWNEKYNFSDFLGGIISFNAETYEKINGYPNNFYGWGGEDDAMYNRLTENNILVYKPESMYKISEMKHKHTSDIQELTNKKKRFNILNDLKNWKKDGINSIKYKINNESTIVYNNVKKFNVDILN